VSSYFVKGYHKLRAIAYDDVDNSNEAAVNINVNVDLPKPKFNWSCNIPSQVSSLDFPIKLSGKLTDLVASQKVRFYQKKKSGNSMNNFVTAFLPDDEFIQIDWTWAVTVCFSF